MKANTESHNGASFAALIIQDSLFRSPSWNQRLTEAAEDFVLGRFPEGLENLIHCCARFQTSVALVEKSLLAEPTTPKVTDLLRSGTSVRLVCRVDGTESQDTLMRLVLSGCYAFVTDKITCTSLRRVIRGVHSGEMVISRKLLSKVLQGLLSGRSLPKLSPRENEILNALAQRNSNGQIAELLCISPETVRWHLRNLYAKTEVGSRLELVRYAVARFGESRGDTGIQDERPTAARSMASSASGLWA